MTWKTINEIRREYGLPDLPGCDGAVMHSDDAQYCPGCFNVVDMELCWCGDSRKYHSNPMHDGHSFVPMGCECHRAPPWTPPPPDPEPEWIV